MLLQQQGNMNSVFLINVKRLRLNVYTSGNYFDFFGIWLKSLYLILFGVLDIFNH